MAPEILPVLDPADHALMLTPEQLRNQNSKNVNVSFLRKTQYMSSANVRQNSEAFMKSSRPRPRQKSISQAEAALARDDPINIRRHIQKGFDLVYPESAQPTSDPLARPTPTETNAWRNPTHADNPHLKPVSTYPILPDFDASTDIYGYASIKFDKPPLPALPGGKRDDRIDVALLNLVHIASAEAAYQKKLAKWESNKELYEHPGAQPFEWDLSVPIAGPSAVAGIKRKLYTDDLSDRDVSQWYDGLHDPNSVGDAGHGIEYAKERSFGAVSTDFPQQDLEPGIQRIVALNLVEGEEKAAYFYPIVQRVRVRADRGKVGAKGINAAEGDENWNHVMLRVREPDAEELARRFWTRGQVDSRFGEEFERMKRAAEEEEMGQDEDGEEVEEVGEEEASVVPRQTERDVDIDMAGTGRANGFGERDADADGEMDED